MSVAGAIALRLALTTRSNPPVAPTDDNTGDIPAIWRGEDADFAVAVFGPDGINVDLSNLAFIELDIFPLPIPAQDPSTNLSYAPFTTLPFPSTPPAPLLSKTVAAASIKALITRADWENGLDQQAIFSFDWMETLSLSLAGLSSKHFGFVVHGITTTGRKLTYGGGALNVFEAGEQGVYLPVDLPPLDVPDGTILYIPPNKQMVFSQTISVEGTVEIEGMMIQV